MFGDVTMLLVLLDDAHLPMEQVDWQNGQAQRWVLSAASGVPAGRPTDPVAVPLEGLASVRAACLRKRAVVSRIAGGVGTAPIR